MASSVRPSPSSGCLRSRAACCCSPRYALSTSGSRATSTGGPSAIFWPASSTTTCSETDITSFMSCSTSTTMMPVAATFLSSSPSRRSIAGVEPRRRLVERQNAGRNRERAGDLDQALVDMRQRAGDAVERTAITDECEQALGQRCPLRVAVGRRTARAPPRRPPRSATTTLSITLIWANSCVVW